MSQLSVSIIINTLNRADYLRNALTSLSHLDYSGFEIIVVNGPSTDATSELLEQWRPRIKLGSCPEANLSMSRNIGISLAAGAIIAFIDDDAAVQPKWLHNLTDWFHDGRVGAVGGYTMDNTGVAFQMRKAICDRFGTAYFPHDWFDERPLCVPGSPLYPSLLGTNSTFRAAALHEIGGFDETFAYFLDETDVCLRLVDHGYRVLFEPSAIVYHQFAESHIRDVRRIPRTLYPSAISKSYFIMRHGARFGITRQSEELSRYQNEIRGANDWLGDHGEIDREHQYSLNQDLLWGIERGIDAAKRRSHLPHGHLGVPVEPIPFRKFSPDRDHLTVCLVSQGYPPDEDAGIAHWTWAMANTLGERGHSVHVITRSRNAEEELRFEKGVWLHQCRPQREAGPAVASRYGVPGNIAEWAARVYREVRSIKSFGLDLVSFPIWDLEGLPCLDDPEIATVVSLHTTYGLVEPFKPEWHARPLYQAFMVDKVIAAERACLQRAPVIHANSQSIIRDIEECYGISIAGRSTVIPRGTHDILAKFADSERGHSNLKVLCVGRFEPRKGFDLAFQAAERMLAAVDDIEFGFVGGEFDALALRFLRERGHGDMIGNPRIQFFGVVPRDRLDGLYASYDVVLMPSRYESFGLVAIEAMSAGKPVIALKVGGLAEVVKDAVNGISIDPGTDLVAGIASALGRLHSDRSWLDRLSHGARQSFEAQYTLAMEADRTEVLFRQAVASLGENRVSA